MQSLLKFCVITFEISAAYPDFILKYWLFGWKHMIGDIQVPVIPRQWVQWCGVSMHILMPVIGLCVDSMHILMILIFDFMWCERCFKMQQ
jgi:hypothetical protein